MPNLGEQWRRGLENFEAQNRRQETETKAAQEQKALQECIDRIPQRIDEAVMKGEASIELLSRFFQDSDISVEYRSDSRRSTLYDLHDRKTVLSTDHLVGWERRLIEWCDKNGLECFFRAWSPSDPNDNDEYLLSARPKAPAQSIIR